MVLFINPPAQEWFYSRHDPSDPRLGDLVKPSRDDALEGLKEAHIAILGFPEDRGIVANGGKPGAALGPEHIRKAFYKLTPGFGKALMGLKIIDIGNIIPGPTLKESHSRLAEAVKTVVEHGVFPIVLGGGHDLSFAGFCGLVEGLKLGQKELGAINVDCHLDVREYQKEITSGTPFRRALEELPNNALDPRAFVEFGIQEPYNSPYHYEWVKKQHVAVMTLNSIGNRPMEFFLEACRIASEGTKAVALSIDIDAARNHEAPGASASNPRGFKAPELERIAYIAGKTGKIRYLDITEMSPPLDEGGRTASLCAGILFWFCKGFSERAYLT
ncbi:MAG: formiminoglutamase [Thermovirga sp.]|jgi:formimidoylglutamase|nr:formiminoglutamase [Thermovirga sp.]